MAPDESTDPRHEERIADLEERLQGLEDQVAIYQLTATYGPVADTGDGEFMKDLFTEDARYVTGIPGVDFHGADEVAAMISSPRQRTEFVDKGGAHTATMPAVRISGDAAVAICHGQVFRFNGEAFDVWRTSATRWDFERTPGGWRISGRTNALLNCDPAGHQLFRSALLGRGGPEFPPY